MCRWQNAPKQQRKQQVIREEAHLLCHVLKNLWVPEDVAEVLKGPEEQAVKSSPEEHLSEALHYHLVIVIFLLFLCPRQLTERKLKGQHFSTDAATLTA